MVVYKPIDIKFIETIKCLGVREAAWNRICTINRYKMRSSENLCHRDNLKALSRVQPLTTDNPHSCQFINVLIDKVKVLYQSTCMKL